MSYLLDRLSEASSWAGLAAMAMAAVNMEIAPVTGPVGEALVVGDWKAAAVVAALGLVAVLKKDRE